MRKFPSNKLWRDKTIDLCTQKGFVIHWKHLDDQEYDAALRSKLREESDEVCSAQSREELVAEIADVFEVIDSLGTLHNLTKDEIADYQAKKRSTNGGFFERKFVTSVEHPEGSPWIDYCLAQPEKYPEIK